MKPNWTQKWQRGFLEQGLKFKELASRFKDKRRIKFQFSVFIISLE